MALKPKKEAEEKKKNPILNTWGPKLIVGGIIYIIGIFLLCKQFSYQRAYPRKSIVDVFNIMMNELGSAPFYFPKSPRGVGSAILIFTLIFGLVCLWMYYREKADFSHVKHGTEEGTAEWMSISDKGLKKWNKTYSSPAGSEEHDGPINTIMTEEIYLSMDTKQTRRNLNTLVVGGSGAGKSRFFVKPNLCEMPLNCSFVCTDPSGELLAETGSMLSGAGYKIKVFNLVEMDESDLYNPLKYVNTDNDIILLVDCILANTTDPNKKGGDDFWEKAQKLMFQALMFFIHNYGEQFHLKKNMNTLMQLMDGIKVSEETQSKENEGRTQEYFNALEKTGWYFDSEGKFHIIPASGEIPAGVESYAPLTEDEQRDSIALKQWHKFMTGAGKTLKSILISAMARLSTLDSSNVAALLDNDTIDINKIGDEKTALFVIIPQENDSFNFLAAMLYTQLFQAMYFHAERECQGNYIVTDSKGENVKIFEIPHKRANLVDEDLNAEEIEIEFANNEEGYVKKSDDQKPNTDNSTEEEIQFDKKSVKPEASSKKMPGNSQNNTPVPHQAAISKEDADIAESVNFQKENDNQSEMVEDPGDEVDNVKKEAEEYAVYIKDNIKCTKKGRYFLLKVPSKNPDEEDEIIGTYTQQYFAQERYNAIKAGCKVKRCGLFLPYHVRFLLDEFANIGSIPDFSKKLATCRKYSISATIILQSINQLKVKYKDDWGTIIGNCDSFLFLGAQEQDTLEYVSKLLGKKTQKTRSTSNSKGGKSGGSNSDSWKGRELMTTDELRRMDNSECIYILRGEHPYKGKKHQFTTHPNYVFTADYDSENLYTFYKKVPEKKFETWELRYNKEIREKNPEEASNLPQVHQASYSGTKTKSNVAVDFSSSLSSTSFSNNRSRIINHHKQETKERLQFTKDLENIVSSKAKEDIEKYNEINNDTNIIQLADTFSESSSGSESNSEVNTSSSSYKKM